MKPKSGENLAEKIYYISVRLHVIFSPYAVWQAGADADADADAGAVGSGAVE